jgi:hypothetical protein
LINESSFFVVKQLFLVNHFLKAKYHEDFDRTMKNKVVTAITATASEIPESNSRVIDSKSISSPPVNSMSYNQTHNKGNNNGLIATYRSDPKQSTMPTNPRNVGSIADYDPLYYEDTTK